MYFRTSVHFSLAGRKKYRVDSFCKNVFQLVCSHFFIVLLYWSGCSYTALHVLTPNFISIRHPVDIETKRIVNLRKDSCIRMYTYDKIGTLSEDIFFSSVKNVQGVNR